MNGPKQMPGRRTSPLTYEYSIVQITRYVNSKDILKYMPDEMPAKERIFGK